MTDLPTEPAAQQRWRAVDDYITDLLVPADAALQDALADSAAAVDESAKPT